LEFLIIESKSKITHQCTSTLDEIFVVVVSSYRCSFELKLRSIMVRVLGALRALLLIYIFGVSLNDGAGFLMPTLVPALSEAPIAFLTLERLQPQVRTQVVIQIPAPVKALPAHLANHDLVVATSLGVVHRPVIEEVGHHRGVLLHLLLL
jgi:hypothetical protein